MLECMLRDERLSRGDDLGARAFASITGPIEKNAEEKELAAGEVRLGGGKMSAWEKHRDAFDQYRDITNKQVVVPSVNNINMFSLKIKVSALRACRSIIH